MTIAQDRAHAQALPRPGRFALFAEMLLVGAIVSVLSLGVVTVLPAMAAGVGHLRRHATLRADRLTDLMRDFRSHLRGVWLYAIGLPVLLIVLAFNLMTVTSSTMPGALIRWVSLALMASVAVVVLRAVGHKASTATNWRDAWQRSRGEALRDLGGSALLLAAVAVCGVVVWMLPILVLVVPGMLALAVVGAHWRKEPGSEV